MKGKVTDEFFKRDQTIHYLVVVKDPDDVLPVMRVRIARNAYDFQSGVYGEIMTELGWKKIWEFPMTESLRCYGESYVRKELNRAPFIKDADLMIQKLVDILS